MFENECLKGVDYEATPAAILMAGIFLSFIVEYTGQRVVQARHARLIDANQGSLHLAEMKISNETVSVLVMEAGIIFHSLLIGLTLVVAGDSYFITLFAVILFHQMFEGIALGTRIAALGTGSYERTHIQSHLVNRADQEIENMAQPGLVPEPTPTAIQSKSSAGDSVVLEIDLVKPIRVPLKKKLMLAAIFAFVTPIGMAIGIGVLNVFNGNDPSTIVAIGTLDALSAGILVWVGIVEMWAEDWMFGGEMTHAGVVTTILGAFGLILGMAVMGLLGKWA
ncbi:hypothetical protein AA313_de0208294 [Arthrobotrys entomopaga]|nr:hypothetical protein AA313_de0208294 [Arthrobotrys entomopaga]